jgi:hypothetical protein
LSASAGRKIPKDSRSTGKSEGRRQSRGDGEAIALAPDLARKDQYRRRRGQPPDGDLIAKTTLADGLAKLAWAPPPSRPCGAVDAAARIRPIPSRGARPMCDEAFDTPEFAKLFKTVWPDAATARAHRLRAREPDLNTLCFEARSLAWGLASSRALIDEAARDGLRRYLDETRMIVAAMPAADADQLRVKLAALGALAPLAAAHGHLAVMLKAALREDFHRIDIANRPEWFVEEEAERKARADAGKRRARRKTRDRRPSEEPDATNPAVALEVLGLSPGASAAEIRSAHRRLIRAVHPDRGGSSYLSARVNAARDALLRER